jgi:uncharacterized protein
VQKRRKAQLHIDDRKRARVASRDMSKPFSFLVLGTALVACGGRLTPPDAAKQIDQDGVTTKGLSGNTEPLVVDWSPAARGNLETSMHDGIAVVSYTDKGMRVLAGCHVDGTYGFIGMSTKQQLIRLENQDEVKANLPLGGLGIAASMGGEFKNGTVLDVGLVMVGKMRTTWRNVTRKDLVGDCREATHFVRGAMVGAFAMNKGQKTEARAVAQVFGLGAGGGTSSNSGFQTSDGKLADCETSSAEMNRPPRQCSALVRLDLQEIPSESTPDKGQPSNGEVNVVRCPAGMVMVSGKCTQAGASTSYECSGDKASDCMAQCEKGNLPSCTKRGIMGLTGGSGANREPLAAAKLLGLSCKNGHARACSMLGYVFQDPNLAQQPDPKSANEAFAKGCKEGDELGCYGLGSNAFFGRGMDKDQQFAVKLMARACEGGHHAACSDLGVFYLGGNGLAKDDAKAARLFKSACDGSNASACSNLGYMVETGTGINGRDINVAARLYDKACTLSDDTCDSLAILTQLGKGVDKNENVTLKLHTRACKAGGVIGCAFLRSYVDPSVSVNAENAKSAFSVWKGTCTSGIARDCTQAAIVAIALGLKEDGQGLMEKACQAGDDWACANKNLKIR